MAEPTIKLSPEDESYLQKTQREITLIGSALRALKSEEKELLLKISRTDHGARVVFIKDKVKLLKKAEQEKEIKADAIIEKQLEAYRPGATTSDKFLDMIVDATGDKRLLAPAPPKHKRGRPSRKQLLSKNEES